MAAVRPVEKRCTKEELCALLDPLLARWFCGKFEALTDPQALAVPLIHERRNVLVSSPTGTGKTLTAFLSILNELFRYQRAGRLEDRIYAVYVSPLKALANDINKNLLAPLAELRALAEETGEPSPAIRVAVRSGDTPQTERQRMAERPPHILITTPESLALVLSAPKFRPKFHQVEYLIVDEIHELCDSKRGSTLSTSLERLQHGCAGPVVRIGLSATQAPIEAIARFLGGYEGEEPREVWVAEVEATKALDLRVVTPAEDLTALSYEALTGRIYDLLAELVRMHRTTLIFTNTRAATESVVLRLRERGVERVEAHHGSLSRETRLTVEDRLKAGELQAVVSSTSLELGIDIGSIDLVCQLGSPKSVAKGLQRIGRAGHAVGAISRGRLVVSDLDDLVECAVLARAARARRIDRVSIPEVPLDVLAQTLVALSLERRWSVEEALELLRRSATFYALSRERLDAVLRYLGGIDVPEGIYPKLWYDPAAGEFGKKKGARMIYYLNQGTIPEEATYRVYLEREGTPVGELSEAFVERLERGDIFVLGGRSYEFLLLKPASMKAIVRPVSGRKPTIPSWTGELLPRSTDLSSEVGRFRRELAARLDDPPAEVERWLREEFTLEPQAAHALLEYFRQQRASLAPMPTDQQIIVEGYVDPQNRRSLIFHAAFGRRINEALARGYAAKLAARHHAQARFAVTDDAFMVTLPRRLEPSEAVGLLRSDELAELLGQLLRRTELFAQRFRHCAARGFLVLRNYRGRPLSVGRQQQRAQRLLGALQNEEVFPLVVETYRELFEEVLDLRGAVEVLERIEQGELVLVPGPTSATPSPFAHAVVLAGMADIILLEDRSALLRELHRQVLQRILDPETLAAVQFTEEAVRRHFAKKRPRLKGPEDLPALLRHTGPLDVVGTHPGSIAGFAGVAPEKAEAWAEAALAAGAVETLWWGRLRLVATDRLAAPLRLLQQPPPSPQSLEGKVHALLEQPRAPAEIARTLGLSLSEVRGAIQLLERRGLLHRRGGLRRPRQYVAAHRSELSRSEALRDMIDQLLASRGPMSPDALGAALRASSEELSGVLGVLEREERVASGRFVLGEGLQYLLARDYIALRHPTAAAFDHETVRHYRLRKSFGGLADLDALFDRFGEIGWLYDVVQRIPGLDLELWSQGRREGRLLCGRFLRGRVRYVRSRDAPRFVSAFRDGELLPLDGEILERLRARGGATVHALAETLDLPREIVKESVDRLDRLMYVVRAYDEGEVWSSLNSYIVSDLEPLGEDVTAQIVGQFLRAQGPVPLAAIRAYTGFSPERILEALGQLGATRILVGLHRTEMYLMPEELPALRATPPGPADGLRILSLYDPFLETRWAEISTKLGEGWLFPILRDGEIVGRLEQWPMSGCIELRALELDNPDELPELLEALEPMRRFYERLGFEILRVREVFGKPVDDLPADVLSAFKAAGFQHLSGFLAKGRFIPDAVPPSQALQYLLWRQGLSADSHAPDMDAALRRFGGFRSDLEALPRVEEFEELGRLHRSGRIVRGLLIPAALGHCTLEDAALYRAAREAPLDDELSAVLRVIEREAPIARSRLLRASPLGAEATAEALRTLQQRLLVAMDARGNFLPIPKLRGVTPEEARLEVVRRTAEGFGLFTAEQLATHLRHEFSMKELRRALRALEEAGSLLKGFLVEGKDAVHWLVAKDRRRLRTARVRGFFVLPPEDRLSGFLREMVRESFPESGRFLVFDGPELVGTASGRLRNGRLQLESIQGGERAERILRAYSKQIGLILQEQPEERLSEWEIADFYERSHPGLRAGTANGPGRTLK